MYECVNVCACVCVCIIYEQDFLFSSLYKYFVYIEIYNCYTGMCAETISCSFSLPKITDWNVSIP